MELHETHILGAKTVQTVVRAHESDRREWLQNAPVCPALARHQIAHVGLAQAAAPYRVVRMKQSGTYFMMAVKGRGQVLVDGRWHTMSEGMACLLPPHSSNAFQCVKGQPWDFAWVRYEAVPENRPISRASSPVMAQHAGQALLHAVLGLHEEVNGLASPAAIHHWVELIQQSVLRFAQPFDMDPRLAAMLEKVAKRPGADWTLEQMASDCHLSKEHLRRLCQQQLGRSPMRQLTHLRMRLAAEMLSDTTEKIETIARHCGYQNAFVFSTTFKRWVGWRPSEHRAGVRGQSSSLPVSAPTSPKR
jgi:AraC-like DNA-binding protein